MKPTYESIYKETNGFTESHIYHKIEITPEMAGKFLTKNTINRPLKKAAIAQYKKDMLAGKFIYNGDSIRFDMNGNLADGQNRLTGVVQSGISIISNIETGLPVEAFETIDQGKKRSSADILYRMEIKNSSTVASGLTLYHNLMDGTNLGKRSMVAPAVISEYIRANTKNLFIMEEIAENAKKWARNIGIHTSPHMLFAIAYAARLKHGENALNFFHLLSDFANSDTSLAKDNPIYVLWHRAFKASFEAKNMKREMRIALIIKAFNLWLNGKRIKVLKWQSQNEAYPEI